MSKTKIKKLKHYLCPCGGVYKKSGKTASGSQRFQCKQCKKSTTPFSKEKLSFKKDVLDFGVDYIKGYCELDTQSEMQSIKNSPNASFYFDDSGLDRYGFERENTNIRFVDRIKYFFNNDEQQNMATSILYPHTVLSWMMSNVDEDNSNALNGYFLGLPVSLIREKDYYIFSWENEKLFSVRKYRDNEKLNIKKDINDSVLQFTFYGTFFALDRLKIVHLNFLDFYKTFINSFTDFRITRFDFCMDFKNKNTMNILENFSALGSPTFAIWDKKGEVETMYFGRYSTKDNKRALIRVYNKLLQIRKKRIEKNYPYYIGLEDVTRFEIEYRVGLLEDFNFKKEDILDEKKLLGMAKDFLSSRSKKLNFDFEGIKRVKRSRKENEKALANYFISRVNPLMIRANECGVTDLHLLTLKKQTGYLKTLTTLTKEFMEREQKDKSTTLALLDKAL